MTTRAEQRRKGQKPGAPFTFDVTCVIGTVEVGIGDTPPHVVAMQLIAEHDAEGTFTFPLPDGGTQRVTVEFVRPDYDGHDPQDD